MDIVNKKEFCILPPGIGYATERRPGLVRHEIFFGLGRRQKSIDLGLVAFLTPEDHNMSNHSVHTDRDMDLHLKRVGQRAAMQHYNWTVGDFIREFGKNYLEDETC